MIQPAPVLPVVYLPGASGRSTVWRAIAESLARRRRPVLIDYPELGDAPPDASVHSLDDLTSWLQTRLPAVFDLVSLSMGSALALRLALACPERVRKLVLVTPAGGVDAAAFSALDWRETFVRRRPDAPRWFVDDRVDLSAELGLVKSATLIVCGELDLIAPPAIGQHLLARLPQARLELVPETTHDLEEEQPLLLAGLIEAHLRKL